MQNIESKFPVNSNMSCDDDTTIHFYAQQTTDGVLTEVAVFQISGNDEFFLARCDDGDFIQDETYHTLHQALAAVLRDHLRFPV